MALVRGHDTVATGIDVGIEDVAYASPAAVYHRVPLLEETLKVEAEQFPQNQELGSAGAQSTVDFGRRTVRGSFSMYLTYNSDVIHVLLSAAFASYFRRNQVMVDASTQTTPSGSWSSHVYLPQSFLQTTAGAESGLHPGLTIRAWKGGQVGSSSDHYVGCMITKVTWDHPEFDRPRITFEFIGQFFGTFTSSTPVAAQTGNIPIKARDLKNRSGLAKSPGILKVGPALEINRDLLSFSVSVESGVEFAPSFLNSPDTLPKPGHVRPWKVTGRIGGLLQDVEYATGNLALSQATGALTGLRIRYVSDTDVATEAPYAADIYLKSMAVTARKNSVDEGGAPRTSFEFESQVATYTAAETPLTGDKRAQICLSLIGKGSNYVTVAQGGTEGGFAD